MSAKQQGLVWELDIPANQQQVLLALADHAHHDGSNARPSVDLIAWKTGRSERHVRRVLGELRESGLIEVTKHGRGGRKNPTEYRLRLDHGPKKPAFRSEENPDNDTGFEEETLTAVSGNVTPETLTAESGNATKNPANCAGYAPETLTAESGNKTLNPDRSGTETLTGAAQNPDSSVRGTVIEPSKNHSAKASARRKSKIQRPDDPLFNAIVEVWRGKPYREGLLTPHQASLVGMVTAELRAVGATPEEVRAEWRRIKAAYPEAGPRALSSHWKTHMSDREPDESSRERLHAMYPPLD